MPIVDMGDMLRHAQRHHYAVATFDLQSLEVLSGVLDAAEHARAPVILNIPEDSRLPAGSDSLMCAAEQAAERASVPVALAKLHASGMADAIHAIRQGCNGVMMCNPQRPQIESHRFIREMSDMAHSCGVSTGGCLVLDDRHDVADTVSDFVSQAGIDILALTAQGCGADVVESLLNTLEQIKMSQAVPVHIDEPAGLNGAKCEKLVAAGVASVNHTASLAGAVRQLYRNIGRQESAGHEGLMHRLVGLVSGAATRCMHLCGSVNQADVMLGNCAPWTPVEHLIIYNVKGLSRQETDAMMREGRRVLGEIPGVRAVLTGHAVRSDAAYQHVWLVRFCHPAVIESYREHPEHVRFADTLFRPVAGERISIDYLLGDAGAPCISCVPVNQAVG